MRDRRVIDRSGKPQRLFKVAVRDLHLLVRDACGAAAVLSTTAYIKDIALNIDLDVLSRNAGELYLDDPAFGRLIDIRRGIPKLSAPHVL